MESSNQHQIRVGIFITIGVVLISASLLVLGGSRVFKKEYRLKVELNQIQGLAEGSVVSLAGINVGNIETLDFSKNDPSKIELVLRIQSVFQKQITNESTIEIRTQGALGDKYLYIEPGKLGGTPLAENSIITTMPDNDILAMLSKNGDRAKEVFDVIEDIHKITAALTHDNKISKIMNALETSSTQLNATLKEGQLFLANARGVETSNSPDSHSKTNDQQSQHSKLSDSINKLNKILTKIDKGDGTLGALINDPTLHEQLKTLLGANRRSQGIKNLMRMSIEKSEDKIKGDD